VVWVGIGVRVRVGVKLGVGWLGLELGLEVFAP
jgi:hypothetical protein